MASYRYEDTWVKPDFDYNEKVLDNYLSPKEVAEYLGISTTAVHNIIKEAGIKVGKKGKDSVKIYPKAIHQILDFRGWKVKHKKKLRGAAHAVKGGVGKTSIIFSLATRYSAYGLKTLVVDIDKQANFTNTVGIDEEVLCPLTMLDLVKDHQKKDYDPSVAILEISDFLHVIPADVELTNLDLEITHQKFNVGTLFKNVLAPIEDDYDVILFDLAGEFNGVSMAVHCYVDHCIIPVNIHRYSEKGLRLTVNHIEHVDRQYQAAPEVTILPNKVKPTTTGHLKRILELTEKYGDKVSETIVPVCPPFETAIDKGTNIWSNTKVRPACNTIEDLAWSLFDLEAVSGQVQKEIDRKKNRSSKRSSTASRGEMNA